ncbi:hypothetical protein SLEP1_g21352 [Rubroshorea leprosula]|uniref:Uncharacterized protein n=1 Tax=Rubroshorea leprosula TaxID=152421 RepID=A0AAV5J5N5_9ROSI|nr:hypothetical protein SLEP1_g21352 [Rubroshorea leprosula]
MSLRCGISPVSLKPIPRATTQLVAKIFSSQLPNLVRFSGLFLFMPALVDTLEAFFFKSCWFGNSLQELNSSHSKEVSRDLSAFG